jgi:hydrogenase maturation protein HypF
MQTQVRRRIDVSGIVQGVGFRPYVHRLATSRHLRGTILNTAAGVTIEIQGSAEKVEDFLLRLPAEAPPLVKIEDLVVCDLPCNGDRDFHIVQSREGEEVHTLISPDVAVCGDCLHELFDLADRRYHYPFINCTNCGPRFTIVRNIPYDRPRTSMAAFPMCRACQEEYDNPSSRRFHAQPNCCWECGPRVELWDRDGRLIEGRDPIVEAAARLKTGSIVAINGLGGFHLALDATNGVAVSALRDRKRRAEKPFAIMVHGLEGAAEFCEINDAAKRILESVPRPIVLLPKKHPTPIVEAVAPCNRYLGVFLPYTPLHYLLFAKGGFSALVMTSGNLSEEPIAIDNREAVARLGGLADCFLVHNRDILLRCDDSVVRVTSSRTQHLRRSRGYVPVPVFLKEAVPSILAVGGELKNTICLTNGTHAFLSQHIGDLENLESYKFFEEGVEHLQEILEIRPEIIAYDLHPDYFSTKWATAQTTVPVVGVQHHHAHVASCMGENHLQGKVIGFALDGTGYGTDGCIWGGEVLVASYEGFERAAHFEYVPMPGGSAALHEPWRMAVGYLAHHFGRDFLTMKLPFLSRLEPARLDLLLNIIERRVNSPLTSSCGRLFDAVAALVGIRHAVSYEAQAAIELEMAIDDSPDETAYPFELLLKDDGWVISTRPLFEALLRDLICNVPVGAISARFHNGLSGTFVQVATLLRQRTALNRVCLSGGTFNNVYLVEHLCRRLQENGFEVFTQSEVPSGDGSLSLGQALIAAHRLSRNARTMRHQ